MTTVEWLVKKYFEDYNVLISELEFQQAKEMEKQQIIDAHGNKTKLSGGVTNYSYTLTGEDYYNETYNK